MATKSGKPAVPARRGMKSGKSSVRGTGSKKQASTSPSKIVMRARVSETPNDDTPKPESVLRQAFLSRSVAMLERVSNSATLDDLKEAIAAPTDLGGLARLIGRMAEVQTTDIDPFAAAYARAVQSKRELAAEAGGLMSATAVAALLEISRQAVDKRRRREQLLAIPSSSGGYVYPAVQFLDGAVADGLEQVIPAINSSSPWTKLSFLLGTSESLGKKRIIDALREGRVEQVVEIARGFGEHAA